MSSRVSTPVGTALVLGLALGLIFALAPWAHANVTTANYAYDSDTDTQTITVEGTAWRSGNRDYRYAYIPPAGTALLGSCVTLNGVAHDETFTIPTSRGNTVAGDWIVEHRSWNSGSNCSTSLTTSATTQPVAVGSVSMSSSLSPLFTTVYAGGIVTYIARVTVTGDYLAGNVMLNATMDANLEQFRYCILTTTTACDFLSAYSAAQNNPAFSVALGNLGAGTREVRMRARVKADSTATGLTSSVNATTASLAGQFNADAPPTTVAKAADLQVTLTATRGGNIATYTAEVLNRGPSSSGAFNLAGTIAQKLSSLEVCTQVASGACTGSWSAYTTGTAIPRDTLAAGTATTVLIRGTVTNGQSRLTVEVTPNPAVEDASLANNVRTARI